MTIDDNLDDIDRILEKHCQNVHKKGIRKYQYSCHYESIIKMFTLRKFKGQLWKYSSVQPLPKVMPVAF